MRIKGMPSTTVDEVISRYKSLNIDIRHGLQDYMNHWVGFMLLFAKDDWQREFGQRKVREDIAEGRQPFKYPYVSSQEIMRKLGSKDSQYSMNDYNHIKELEQIVDIVNTLAMENKLTPEVSRYLYEIMHVYWYGKRP